MGRASALLGLLAALALYDSLHERLWQTADRWDIAFIAAVLIPVSFAVVWVLLPLRNARGLLPVGAALAFLTYAFHVGGWATPENLTKLVAVTLLGFWFLGFFEAPGWVVLVALIVPWVDAYSVWRGPTHQIVAHHEHVFTTLSYAFPVPGERAAANLGVPDLLFFSLFLAASARFGLRRRATWCLLVVSLAATIVAVYVVGRGLAALPALSFGFLAPNLDVLWLRLRRERRAPRPQGQP